MLLLDFSVLPAFVNAIFKLPLREQTLQSYTMTHNTKAMLFVEKYMAPRTQYLPR